MASEAESDADRYASNGSRKPIYDGTIESFEPFSIKAKAYFQKQKWLAHIFAGTSPANTTATPALQPSISAETEAERLLKTTWLVMDTTDQQAKQHPYTSQELMSAVLKKELNPINCVAKSIDKSYPDYVSLSELVPMLYAAGVTALGSPTPEPPDQPTSKVTQTDMFYEIVLMIDDRKSAGAALLKKINKKFPQGKESATELS